MVLLDGEHEQRSRNLNMTGATPSTGSTVVRSAIPALVPYTNKELAAILPEFSGSGQNVRVWLERVDSVQNTYRVPDAKIQLIAVGKFIGQAKNWYQSRVEYVQMDWDTFKREMKKMYDIGDDPVELRRKMEKRRWKKSERFSTYYHENILLGNNANVSEGEMIHYMIDGFEDRQLKNQARMMLANISTLEDLFNVMTNVCREEKENIPMHKPQIASKNFGVLGQGTSSAVSAIKCYNCHREGHKMAECTKPRREKGTCFECGSKDHRVKDCPKKNKKYLEPDSTAAWVEAEERISACHPIPAYIIDIVLGQKKEILPAVVDTGSPICLISEDVIERGDILPYNSKETYLGLNKSPLNIVGIFPDVIRVSNILVRILFHVVPAKTMSFKVFLGRDFISKKNLKFEFGDGLTVVEINERNVKENGNSETGYNVIFLIDEICYDKQQEIKIDESFSLAEKTQIQKTFV